ncbi:hypothetical protein [Phenylobacterium sp.]|uniref:hypothetical protein n=1 Tax=Phenylobacterium sp. TaxID=1871053 RepID=UPI0035AEFA18
MSDISVGAVGAAVIAGLISLLGLVIGKEQKVSEFRQAWIDDLRRCMIGYLVNINAISDAIRLSKSGAAADAQILLSHYKMLNEASHGISLRINPDEKPAKALLEAMRKFEELASSNKNLSPARIQEIEEEFVSASKSLLKFEWIRVKRGEKIFVWTKRLVVGSIVAMLLVLVYGWRISRDGSSVSEPAQVQVHQPVHIELSR